MIINYQGEKLIIEMNFYLGHLLSIQVQNIRNLEQALDAYRVLDDVDKPLCIDFLRSMLRLKPSDRASAAELLEHAWIKP